MIQNKHIIQEGSRDNLLLPYLEILHQHGIPATVGQFKSRLLNKLGVEGGITNLSSRSNYYLVGCARYYFEGQLTTNKDLSLLKPEAWEKGTDVQDQWNQLVCQKLNFLINILREAYIDSVGTQFLEPEDFGTLPLKKLLSKYNRQIKKAMGVVDTDNQMQNMSNPNVAGGNYTFEIIYSIDDCRKYKEPTAPGSWCISYSEGNYNYYTRNLNIHYVIFRMNGWEKVERPENPTAEEGFTPEKPHDLYGNSLIAVLQSNKSPEPVYITSRWNHGHGNIRCEADHAYTKEEFQQITGTSDDDLKRIYELWKTNYGKQSKRTINKALINDIRKAKYAQIRINSGENPEEILSVVKTIVGEEGSKIKKSITVCKIKPENERDISNAVFLVDRGNIVFESALLNYRDDAGSHSFVALNNVILGALDGEKRYILYCYKTHQLVDVEGVTVFKYAPCLREHHLDYFKSNPPVMCEIKQAREQVALINMENGKPVELPNGSSWANTIYVPSRYTMDSNKISCRCYEKTERIFEIVFDLSSREKYFYDSYKNTFITMPQNKSINNFGFNHIVPDSELANTEPTIDYTTGSHFGNSKIVGVKYLTPSGYNYLRETSAMYLYNIDDKKVIKFGNIDQFVRTYGINENIVMAQLSPTTGLKDKWICLNTNDSTALGINGKPILCTANDESHGFLRLLEYNRMTRHYCYQGYIYDTKNDCFLVSPFDNSCIFNFISTNYMENLYNIVKDLNNVDDDETPDASINALNPYEIKKPNTYQIKAIPAQHIQSDDDQQLSETINISLYDIKLLVEQTINKLIK